MALKQVNQFVRTRKVYDLAPLIVLEAARGVRDYETSHHDAQIWTAVRLNQVPTIFSGDFNVGATIEGDRFINPFAPEFVLNKRV